MLKIHGRDNSSNVQKVMICVFELGLAHERLDVGGAFGGTRTPEYLDMNPNSRVPTIDDDGFILWESNAIVRYLAARHGLGTLCPSDPQARADADRWMDWQQTTVAPAITPVFWQLVRTPEAERDMAAVAKGKTETAACMAILDRRLAGRDYMMGGTLTMADIPLGVMVRRWYELAPDAPKMDNLAAWYGRLKANPAFRKGCLDVKLT